jgi:hypothetical protein
MNSIKKKIKQGLLIFVTLMVSTNTYAATTQIFDGSGQMVGITGIEVSGYGTWDVSLNNFFVGTVPIYDKAFAQLASDALLVLYTGGGLFQGTESDFKSEKNKGCEFAGGCLFVTLYEKLNFDWYRMAFFQNKHEVYDSIDLIGLNHIQNRDFANVTFLDWTQSSVSTVPVPAALFMFAPALLGFLGFRRKVRA